MYACTHKRKWNVVQNKVSILGVKLLLPFRAWLFLRCKKRTYLPILYNLGVNKISSKLEILQWNSLNLLNKISNRFKYVLIKSILFFKKKKQTLWHFWSFLWTTIQSLESAATPGIPTLGHSLYEKVAKMHQKLYGFFCTN